MFNQGSQKALRALLSYPEKAFLYVGIVATILFGILDYLYRRVQPLLPLIL